jgi:hypothetical protein
MNLKNKSCICGLTLLCPKATQKSINRPNKKQMREIKHKKNAAELRKSESKPISTDAIR